MHRPTQFDETRREVLLQAIQDIQFAAIVTQHTGAYHCTQAPMIVRDDGSALRLECHFARANGHWRCLQEAGRQSLAIFQGPSAYVSPSWYPSKQEHGKVVPTWNYIAVHAHGALSVVNDRSWLLDHLNRLTERNEQHRESPWQVVDAPERFISSLTRGIVGVVLDVDRIEGMWKLSQNRSDADKSGVAAGMQASDCPSAHALVRAMRSQGG